MELGTKKSKTSVTVKLELTWKNRWNLLRMAFSPSKTVELYDDNVREVLIKEHKPADV